MDWTVFPKPISSARIPLIPCKTKIKPFKHIKKEVQQLLNCYSVETGQTIFSVNFITDIDSKFLPGFHEVMVTLMKVLETFKESSLENIWLMFPQYSLFFRMSTCVTITVQKPWKFFLFLYTIAVCRAPWTYILLWMINDYQT